jgi:nucleotide-binding universal stress UspA family protein
MLEHLCVAYDESRPARWALEHAVRLARLGGARLTIAHVAALPEDVVDERVGIVDDLLPVREDVRYRQRLVTTLAPLTRGVETEVRVFTGPTAPTLIELLRTLRADLVVAGAHERPGLRRRLSLPLRDALLLQAPCPVALVRSPVEQPQPTVLALVGEDPSRDIALPTARALAADLRATLIAHPGPRHSRDLTGIAAAVCAAWRHRPLVTVVAGQRLPGTRRRAGRSTAETLGGAGGWPLVVVPPRLRRERFAPTYRVRGRTRSVLRHGLHSPADRSRAVR